MKSSNPFSTDPLNDTDLLSGFDDGCPKAPEGRAVPPWLRAAKWRVAPLAKGKMSLFPPTGGKPADVFIEQDHLVGTGFRPPMVVIGPAGAGLTTFHRWIRLRAKQATGAAPAELDFARIAQTDDPAKQRRLLASRWFGSDEDADLSDDFARMLDEFLLPRSSKAQSNKKRRTHVLLRVDRFHPKNKEILLGRLRDLVERRTLDGERFAVLAHETAPLEDAEPFSSFLAVCEVYRLADFTAEDIEGMWRDWVPDRAAQASELARQCVTWTGGQPVLANLYLGHLLDITDPEKKIEIEAFDQTGSWLAEHPPQNALQHWQGELARIVTESSLLRRKVGSFLVGENRETVTREELPLFLAGWIGQDADGRWGIRSKVHKRWAEGPLHAPERYRSAIGGGR